MLSSGFSVKAFSGTEYGEEYLSFGQNERIRRSSTLEEGWAWGWLDDSSCGWFPPNFWKESEQAAESCHAHQVLLTAGISLAAFDGMMHGEEYLTFQEDEQIRRSPTLEEGWAWGLLEDGRSGWFFPDFWREVEDQHLSCPCAISCLDTSKFLIVDDVAAGGSPVDEELQTCMSDDRNINISVVSFAGIVCVVRAHITDDIGTIWDRLKRESAKAREVLPKHISFFIGTSAMEVSDISSLLHVADAQRLVTINVTRDLTILPYYFKVWVEDDCPFLVDSSSSDQAEDVVNDTTTEDPDSDSSDNVWEATITRILANFRIWSATADNHFPTCETVPRSASSGQVRSTGVQQLSQRRQSCT